MAKKILIVEDELAVLLVSGAWQRLGAEIRWVILTWDMLHVDVPSVDHLLQLMGKARTVWKLAWSHGFVDHLFNFFMVCYSVDHLS